MRYGDESLDAVTTKGDRTVAAPLPALQGSLLGIG